ncbi:MAG: protein kinase [Candidatus Wallbacteria bacterium]|nr:protein kinase [Candidatus Wallbacteria bacterium]
MAPGKVPERLGRYELKEQIGSGGMGTVFRAFDPKLQRYVAVKIVRPQIRGLETVAERFRREALALARLTHPGIVHVFDNGEEAGMLFLVMELLEGTTLQSRVPPPGDPDGGVPPPAPQPFDSREFLDVFTQLADAIWAVHKQGLLHRDIKPANILVGVPERGAVLTDFGLAWMDDDAALTRQGSLMGTHHYMAPEQATGERATPASDVFSLGASMFEYATGRKPFAEIPSATLLAARRTADLPPIALAAPGVPEAIADIIDRAVQRDPAKRYESGRELHRALTRAARELALESGAVAAPGAQAPRPPGAGITERRANTTVPLTVIERAATALRSLGSSMRPRWLSVSSGALAIAVAAAVWRGTPPASGPQQAPTASTPAGRSAAPTGSRSAPQPATHPAAEQPVTLCQAGQGAMSATLGACDSNLLAAWVDLKGHIAARFSPDDGRTWVRPPLDGTLMARRDTPLALTGYAGRFILLYASGLKDRRASVLAAMASATASAWSSPTLVGTIVVGEEISLVAARMADGSDRMLAAWPAPGNPPREGMRLAIAWGDAARGVWFAPALQSFPNANMEHPVAILTPEEGVVVWQWNFQGALITELVMTRSKGPGKPWPPGKGNTAPGIGLDRNHLAAAIDDDRVFLMWNYATLGAHRPREFAASTDGLRTLEWQRPVPPSACYQGWPHKIVARNNRIWASWMGRTPDMLAWSASKDGGRTWTDAKPFANTGYDPVPLSMALDSAGRPWVCWGDRKLEIHAMALP